MIVFFKDMYMPSKGQNRNPNSSAIVPINNRVGLLVYTIHLSSPPPEFYTFSLPFPAHIVTVS